MSTRTEDADLVAGTNWHIAALVAVSTPFLAYLLLALSTGAVPDDYLVPMWSAACAGMVLTFVLAVSLRRRPSARAVCNGIIWGLVSGMVLTGFLLLFLANAIGSRTT